MKRTLAILLAFAMLFALAACAQEEATPTETTQPGAEQFKQIYQDAVAKLEAADAVTLDVELSEVLIVEDRHFETHKQQVVAYSGLNTDKPLLRMEENVKYSEDEEAEEDATTLYTETYTDGTLYVELKDTATFTGTLSQEDAAARYIPVTLLDPSLYGEVTMDTAANIQNISFSLATAAESWAMPAGATLEAATGYARINADGTVKSMDYTINYQYGTAHISRSVVVTPRAEALEVKLPEKADSYQKLQYPLALYTLLESQELLELTDTATSTLSETYVSQAGGIAIENYKTINMHGIDENILTKFDSTINVYAGKDTETEKTEQIYRDGKYTITTDEGIPTVQSGVKPKEARETALDSLTIDLASPEFW